MNESDSDISRRRAYRLLVIIYTILIIFFIQYGGLQLAILFTALVGFVLTIFVFVFYVDRIVYWLGKPKMRRLRKKP